MINFLLIIFGKVITKISQVLNLGAGSTWPGHITLSINKNFIRKLQTLNPKLRTILIAGTNGKTTTAKILKTILEADRQKVIHNASGANLLNGIASTLIQHSNIVGKINGDLAIFEVDENTLPEAVRQLKPDFLILLNLFRDQLDRYGEVDAIVKIWKVALDRVGPCQIFLNADDPCLAFLGRGLKNPVFWFGLEDEKLFLKEQPHAMDVIYCPSCGGKLEFSGIYFAHLGKWHCPSCGFTRPKISYQTQISPLPGIYNLYNLQAAILTSQKLGVAEAIIKKALANFTPAFGRQEEFQIDGKKIKIFLSKNPTGFNESIRTAKDLGGKNFLLVLNDRIPDGRDVSWIWDVDTEELVKDAVTIFISGDRAYDLGLRIKYSSSSEFLISNFQFSMKISNFTHRQAQGDAEQGRSIKFQIETNLKKAIALGLKEISKSETLYILPTYSAMLEVRKILTGKKIL